MHMRRAIHVLRRVYVHVACSYAYKHAYMGITMHTDMSIYAYMTSIYAYKHAYICA